MNTEIKLSMIRIVSGVAEVIDRKGKHTQKTLNKNRHRASVVVAIIVRN